MTIWELYYDGANDHAPLVSCEIGSMQTPFWVDGTPKHWAMRPKVEPFIEKRRKKAKPRADLSYLLGGSIVLNEKAYLVMQDFLLPFGQLLELDCLGEVEYFYNVTNLLPCIDYERSQKRDGIVYTPVFTPSAIPIEPTIFKDAHTAGNCIYFNQAGREKFEQLAGAAGLFGVCFLDASKDQYEQIRALKAAAQA